MFANKYRQRLVSDTDKRGCFICYKPSTTVLVNEVPSADFFYICAPHLKDKGFAKELASSPTGITPLENPPAPQLPPKPDLSKEIADLKKEWDAVKKPASTEEKSTGPAKKEDSESGSVSPQPAVPKGPVFYELNAQIFKLRIDARKRVVQDRKTRQFLATQSFPTVPGHVPTQSPTKPST